MKNKDCGVTLHIAREEPSGSFNYCKLDSISTRNIPDIYELGYKPDAERFLARGMGSRSKQEKLEVLGRKFFDEVIKKHFSNE